MKVIPPITLNSTNIVSDAPTDIDPPEWDISASYVRGDRVKVTTGTPSLERIYECIVDANTSVASPEIDVNRSVPHWVDSGPTNAYAMFDLLRDTKTIATNSTNNDITVVLIPGQPINSLACLGMEDVLHVSVSVERLSSPGTIIYTNQFNLTLRFTNSWYTYFYGAFREKTACILFDLPSQYTDLVITIVFSGHLSYKIGACILGNYSDIGSVQRGASVEATNFSNVNRDNFGNVQLIQRRNVPKTSQKLFFDKSRLKSILVTKASLDAVPAVWSGLDDEINNDYFDALLILGFYRDFSIDISNPVGVFANLQLEEI